MDLKDFGGGVLTPEDFANGSASMGITLGGKTASQAAASTVLLEGSPTVEGYKQLKESLLTSQGRQTFFEKNMAIRDNLIANAQSEMTNIILDNEISDQQKLSYVEAANTVNKTYNPSTLNTLAEQTLVADSEIDENDDEAESRSILLDTIGEVNNQKRRMQAVVNAYKQGKDEGIASTIMDMGELMAPLAEWIHYDQLLNDVAPDDPQAVLMGNQKQQIYETIQNAPFEQKEAMVAGLLEILNNNENVVLPDGNDLINVETLERMLLDNDYSTFERHFDNITSLLDITGVGVLARSTLKGARATEAVAGAANRAAQAIPPAKATQVAEEAVGAVAPVPEAPRAISPKEDTAGWIRDNPDAKFSDIDKMYRQAADETEGEQIARLYSTRTEVAPASTAMIIKDTNPRAARNIHNAVEQDTTGEMAEAMYGTTRDEALSKDILPEPDLDGSITNKVTLDNPRPQFEEPGAARTVRTTDGESYLTDNEVTKVQNTILKKLEEVNGMVPRREGVTIAAKPDGTSTYKMMYSFKDGGFRTMDDARKAAAFNFRQFGAKESDFAVYARRGDKWVPITDKEANAAKVVENALSASGRSVPSSIKEVDYAIGFEYNYRFDPTEDIYDALTIKRNWADTLPTGIAFATKMRQGSVVQNLVPMTMYMDPTISRSALALTDRATRLRKVWTKQFEKFSKDFGKLPTKRREAVRSYIEEANLNGIPLNYTDIKARGFSDKEYDTLKEWRKSNDMIYYAANDDMATSLRNKGYQIFEDVNGTHLVVKPVGRNAVSANTSFYDSAANNITNFTKAEMDDFYSKGGTMSRLSSPAQINGQWVEFVKTPQTPAGGYTRAINYNETVLNYREGYYPVMYDAEFFIEKKILTADGEEKWIVVASSKSKADADDFTKNLARSSPTDQFRARPDRNRAGEKDKGVSEDGWTLGVNSGVSSQRVRGQRLTDTTNVGNQSHQQLLDPLEAVTQQINRLSERVVMRNLLDSMKSRWVNNYFDKMGMESNKYGEKFFPDDLSQIKGFSETSIKTKADARTMFNYIQQLEYGFRNMIDDTVKASLHTLADLAADVGMKTGEAAVRGATNADPTQIAKSLVFKMYLASNPFRQLFVQGHQFVQLAAINPTYLPRMFVDLAEIMKVRYGISNSAEHKRMAYEMIESGILESVDQNNLIRKDLSRLADETNMQKLGKMAGMPLNALQRIGFDAGEQWVLMTSWLTHYDMLKRSGKPMSRRNLDAMAGQARSYTYAMNKAGDTPYNTNTLNILFQFLQVPHKAIFQPFFDRTLTRQQRAQLLAWNTVMYGVPGTALATLGLDITGETAEEIKNGLIDMMYNDALTLMSGEAQNIDFSDFNPVNAYGLYESIEGMLTTNIGSLFAKSPAGSLFVGANPRITNAMKKAAMWVNPYMDYQDPMLDTRYSDVLVSGASLFSGMSNLFKARYAFQTGKKMSALGNTTDEDVSKVEAAFQVAGFRTRDESGRSNVNKLMFEGEYNPTSDVQIWYGELKRHLASRGVSIKEHDYMQRVLSEAWTVWEDHEWQARKTLSSLIEADLEKGDHTIFEGIRRQIGIKDVSEVKQLISQLPASQQKSNLITELQQYEAAVAKSREASERKN